MELMKKLTSLLLALALILCAGCGQKSEEPEVSYDEEEQIVYDSTDDLYHIIWQTW